MAQQIVIDIVAETKKLTEGLNKTNDGINDIQKNLKTATKTAATFASAFVLKKGVEWLKEGVDGVYDAQKAMKAATSAFGEGSEALKKITEQATKFGKELGMDNDDIIKLSTSIGVKLPKDAQSASAELVLLAKNLEATSGGSIAAEATLSKLGKAFADGEVSAKELQKTIPGLDDSTYKMAETLSKAGKNQEALNVLIEAGEKKYGGAAASQVTASQRLQTALDDLKESMAEGIVPIIEKMTGFLVTAIEKFQALPKPIQDFSLGLLALVGIGGPLISFVANLQASLVQLGLLPAASGAAATGLNLVKVALAGLGIGLIIAAIVLLIQHWDDLSAVAKKVYDAVTKWLGEMFDKVKGWIDDAIKWAKENWPTILAVLTGPFGLFVKWLVDNKDDILQKAKDIYNTVKDWLGENWPKILAVLTGPFGLFALWVVTHKEDLKTKFGELWEAVKTVVSEKIEAIKTWILDKWESIKDGIVGEEGILVRLAQSLAFLWGEIGKLVGGAVDAIKEGILKTWNSLKDKTTEVFTGIKTKASEIWTNIKNYIIGVVENVVEKFNEVRGKMIEVGKDIARGIIDGLLNIKGWFVDKLTKWVNDNIPSVIRKVLEISSPSKVMYDIGKNIVQGLSGGITKTSSNLNVTSPVTLPSPSPQKAPVSITINAGAGTDPYALGRTVQTALNRYSRVSNRTGNYTAL